MAGKGFLSALVPSVSSKKEAKAEEKKEDEFLNEVKASLEGRKDAIAYLVDLIKKEEDAGNAIKLRLLLAETFKNSYEANYHIIYDSYSEGLEPVYFWVLDFVNSIGFKVEKTKEDFAASVGSAFFGEMSGRATKMQEQAIKMMGTINALIRSVINLIYDLKEFDIRLRVYEEAKSENPDVRTAAELSLRQVWMDQVDIKKGMGSINQMAQGQLQFVTLRDAYLSTEKLEDIDKPIDQGGLDLNERVKRILKIKLAEYFKWKEYSEKELRNRYAIEKAYLKSQYASLKLYAEWTKPYLLAAKKLDMKVSEMASPNLVSVFNNMEMELELSGRKELGIQGLIDDNELPENAAVTDKYFQYMTVLFKFRSVPHSVSTPQGYQYRQGGRVDIYFKAYGLSQKELDEIKKSEEDETYKLVTDMIDASLGAIKEDLEFYGAKEEKKEEKEEEGWGEPGPITLLASGLKGIFKPLKGAFARQENYFDAVVKLKTKEKASGSIFTVYDVYKKAHGMMSF